MIRCKDCLESIGSINTMTKYVLHFKLFILNKGGVFRRLTLNTRLLNCINNNIKIIYATTESIFIKI